MCTCVVTTILANAKGFWIAQSFSRLHLPLKQATHLSPLRAKGPAIYFHAASSSASQASNAPVASKDERACAQVEFITV